MYSCFLNKGFKDGMWLMIWTLEYWVPALGDIGELESYRRRLCVYIMCIQHV